MRLFGFYYTSVGSIILFFIIATIISYPFSLLADVLPKALLMLEKIDKLMADLRSNPPMEIAGRKVRLFKDFKLKTELNCETKVVTKLTLPVSNVLQFILEDDTYITARPSGTEPKIKFYFGVNDKDKEKVEAKLADTMKKFLATVM